MDKPLVITSSPHFRATTTTRIIMTDVLIALLPTLAAATYIFGFRSLLVSVFCVTFCICLEFVYQRLMGQKYTYLDMSAAITGLLLAFNLPATIPLWMAAIGCFAAIIIVKQLFGGLGKNFANPAIVGRIVLLVSFATQMTRWALPRAQQALTDSVTGATPLALSGADMISQRPEYLDMFLGMIGGSLGETCKLTLLLGGAYLVIRKVISPTAPLAFMGTVFLLTWIFGQDPVYHLLAGGLILGAIFMATDYVTTPVTEKGKLIFGIGCGVFTVIIRLWASYPEGVSFAILLMNILTPHIDRACSIKAFGGAKADE